MLAQYPSNDPSELTEGFFQLQRELKKLRLLMATHKNFPQKTKNMNEQFNLKYTLRLTYLLSG